jgi:hypothetical protein
MISLPAVSRFCERLNHTWRPAALGLLVLAMAGCETYVLRGQVISGNTPAVLIVESDDARLQSGMGIMGAKINLTLDPRSLGREPLGETVTSTDGSFSMPLDLFGAGTLLHEVGVVARAQGYNATTGEVILPSAKKRMLVIMVPGRDRYVPPEDPLEDVDRFMHQ